jgi:aryl-alcohol dehydrogenase-like predicted oxidoreductase
MERRKVGLSDLVVSVVGLGCNNFGGRVDFEGTRAVVEAALEAGVTFFDTADVYGNGGGSERFLGELLEGRREQVVIATKFGWNRDGSPDHVRRAIDASLDRLRTDYVDLYYYHRPDGVTPFAETLGAMHELVAQGKVRHLGCSNLPAAQLREVHEVTRSLGIAPVVALQNEYSLLQRSAEEDVLPLCRELGAGFVPYFPLASGLLTGKYQRGAPAPAGSRLAGRSERLSDDRLSQVEALERFAEERGHTLLELAIGALASQPAVASVIAGATRPEQVRANAAAAGWRLSQNDFAALAALAPVA